VDFREYFDKLTFQVMSPYNYDDDKKTVEDDDEQHETTTVPASTAIKSIHRFQSIDFLVGLETPHLPQLKLENYPLKTTRPIQLTLLALIITFARYF
jgi:hypothetical protein